MLLPQLRDIPVGLIPLINARSSEYSLVMKCSKEAILTAKIRTGFKFYFAPVRLASFNSYAIITAFFDDDDEPLCIRTPLFDEQVSYDSIRTLSQRRLNVHFFDEHTRELLGYRAIINDSTRFSSITKNIELGSTYGLELTPQFFGKIHDSIIHWFAHRTTQDDAEAFSVTFESPLFPEDLFLQDARREFNSYHGRKSQLYTALERKEPGHFSELDIVHALLRVFESTQIFLNPLRADTGREFVDILVATSQHILLIQAKDSPNTQTIINRSIDRKKAAIVSHVKKGSRQIKGSISYTKSRNHLHLLVDDKLHRVPVHGRQILGLVVAKELFLDEMSIYSDFAFQLYEETTVPCAILDYSDLHSWTLMRNTEERFFDTFNDLILAAFHLGEFPRFRIWPDHTDNDEPPG